MSVTPVHTPDFPRHDVPRGGRSGFTVTDDHQVHYLEWGRVGSPPVLCLHGGGQTAYMFEEFGSAHAGSHHVLAPDLPSHGDSGRIEEFGPNVIAETIPPLLESFGFDAVHVVGASLGGMTGLVLAAERPELVRSISLIDVGHKLEPEGVKKIVEFMSAHESFASLEAAADEIAKYLPQRKKARPESLTRNLRQRDDGRWVWKHAFGEQLRDAGPEVNPAENLPELLDVVQGAAEQVRCPVLVLRGSESDVLSAEGAAAAVQLIPDARLEIVEKAGHLAAGDNPHSTVNIISGFLAEFD